MQQNTWTEKQEQKVIPLSCHTFSNIHKAQIHNLKNNFIVNTIYKCKVQSNSSSMKISLLKLIASYFILLLMICFQLKKMTLKAKLFGIAF